MVTCFGKMLNVFTKCDGFWNNLWALQMLYEVLTVADAIPRTMAYPQVQI